MGDPDPAVIKKTQMVLGNYVKKPALTDKLLKKPPFRFLHDVVNVVIKDTDFLKGLFTPEELNSDNIKDRDAKIAYLQKLIDVTKSVTGQELKVRPSKVVAGLEPEKTNELLQAIGYALDKKLDSTSAVKAFKQRTVGDSEKINNGTVAPHVVKNKEDKKKDDKKSNERDKDKDKAKEKEKLKDKEKDKSKPKEKERSKRSNDTEKDDSKAKKDKPDKINKTKEKEKKSNTVKSDKSKPSKVDVKSTSDRKKLEKQISKDTDKSLKRTDSIKEEPTASNSKQQLNNIGEISYENVAKDTMNEIPISLEMNGKHNSVAEEDMIAVIDEEADMRKSEKNSSRRSSLKKQGSLTASENNALGDLNQYNGLEILGPSRQNSAFLGEPIIRHDSDPIEPIASEKISPKPPMNRQQSVDSVMRPRTSLRPPSVRPPSARPGAPRRKERNVEIVLQPNETTKLGEINVKMEVFNNELLDDDGENLIVIEDPTQASDFYGGSQANDTDGNEEQGHLVQQILETQKEFSSIAGVEITAETPKKIDVEWSASQRQSSVKQMETLRESIQKLTRSVNPLGKLMDFIQEDIDSMERELINWQQIYSRAIVDLNKERSINENAIEPLKHQLAQIETNIKEYRDMVDITRANILQNEQKIERLYMTEI